MKIFLLTGKDPTDQENPEKTWIVVAEREMDARKVLGSRSMRSRFEPETWGACQELLGGWGRHKTTDSVCAT